MVVGLNVVTATGTRCDWNNFDIQQAFSGPLFVMYEGIVILKETQKCFFLSQDTSDPSEHFKIHLERIFPLTQ